MAKNRETVRRLRRQPPGGDKGYLPHPYGGVHSTHLAIATGGVLVEFPFSVGPAIWIKRLSARLWTPAPSLVLELFKGDPTGLTGKERAELFVAELVAGTALTNYSVYIAEDCFLENDDNKASGYLLVTHAEAGPISLSLYNEFIALG